MPRLIHPRVLNKTEAADYLGISLESFGRICDVRPLPFEKVRGERYDVKDLDSWLDKIKCPEKSPAFTSIPTLDDGSSTSSIAGGDSMSALHSAIANATRPKPAFTSSSPKPPRRAAR